MNRLYTDVKVAEEILTIQSDALSRSVTCTLLTPGDYDMAGPLHLLLLNDGQELESLKLKQSLQELYGGFKIVPVMVAAIHAGDDRLQEYGVAGQADYKGRGSRAEAYNRFVLDELLPQLRQHIHTENFATIAFAGCSLGGLTAFDMVWRNADIFNKAGVFSGSFWWRSKGLEEGYDDNDRIMHRVVRSTEGKPDVKFWIQTGTEDETADRNKNGIIDSIDDAIDLIKELELKGYKRPEDIQYLEVVGGKHDVATWAAAMPKFLCWAFKA